MNVPELLKRALSSEDEGRFNDIVNAGVRELKKRNKPGWSASPKDMPQLVDRLQHLPDKSRAGFLLQAMKFIDNFFNTPRHPDGGDPRYMLAMVAENLLSDTLRKKIKLDDEDIEYLVHGFMYFRRTAYADVGSWPIALFITAVGLSFDSVMPEKAKSIIEKLKAAIQALNQNDKDTVKLIDKMEAILFRASAAKTAVRPERFLGDDRFAGYANDMITQQPDEEKQIWFQLILLAQKATGSKPSAKFLEQSHKLIHELPEDSFRQMVTVWFDYVARLKEITVNRSYSYGDGHVTNYVTTEFLHPPSLEAVKGFVWMSCHVVDTNTLNLIAALCERSFKKIPGQGPTAGSLGNACLFTLYKSKGLEGIAHLSRLKLRIKQNNTQNLIEKYLQEAASSHGVTVNEIEDLAVDGFGLHDGKREYELDGYKAILRIAGIGDVCVDWYKPDGTPLKAAPAVLKDKHAESLKKIKDTAKQVAVALTAQRDRIDRMFRSQREMIWPYFVKHYFTQGLLSYLVKDIIWTFKRDNDVQHCIYLDDHWTTLQSKSIQPDEAVAVSLWHPSLASVAEIRDWRHLLMEKKIRQPIKQAFREVYLLTDAEVNTRTYSNRMAAHILKQHQFNSLAKIRGWKYSLLGAYDDGRNNEIAELLLRESNIRAEFWVNEVNADDAFNDTGIWNYVSTDQVRFVNLVTNEPMELSSVPAVIFSEVMRDVDLFVGVASVGNDPTWNDSGGVPAYRDYWQSYSFGELTEIAKTRRDILENLVPRLKIAKVATVQDKYLVVTGKKRTYKIHIGSTNILMEPNDQYLCIVADRSKKDMTGNVFLPFEGDGGLSVILSKAMLLAEDDKITDPTILSQINRK